MVRSSDPKSFFATRRLAEKCTTVRYDLQNTAVIRHYLQKYAVTRVFHLAAQADVQCAVKNPEYTYRTNIMGTVSILEACRNCPSVSSIVVAITDKVYGEMKGKAYSENDPLLPTHPYDVSKAAADLVCRSYAETYGLPVSVVHAGNIYGEGDSSVDRIIPSIMKTIVKNETLKLRSNGKHLRNYIYVKDVTSAYIMVAENMKKTKSEAYNVGSEENYSVIDLIRAYEKALSVKIDFTVENTAKFELSAQSLDSTKLKNALDWKTKYTLSSTTSQLLAYYRSVL